MRHHTLGAEPARNSLRLSRHDSAFMYLDNEVTAHEGYGLSIFQGTVPFEHMQRRMLGVIPEAPKFLQRPVRVPLGLGHPTWEYVPDFDINYHFQHLHLEPPGTEEQLWDLVERLANERLNHEHPLWRMYLIEGLSHGRCATFSKIHHTLTDGMGALKVMMANIETEPVTPKPLDPDEPLPPIPERPQIPTGTQQILRALQDNARATVRNIGGLPKRLRRYGRRITSRHLWKGLNLIWRYIQAPTIRFPFNRGLSGRVHFATFSMPIEEMRAIRAKSGGTVNDVLLATVAGGLDRYAVRNGYDTAGKFMLLQIPTNIRTEETDTPLGNHVGAAPLLVPFGIEHPVERLHGVTQSMREAKECNIGYGMRVFLDGFEAAMTPPGMRLIFAFARWRPYQRFMAKIPRKPTLHLYISNMPGPEFATYTLGCKLLARHPMGPVIPGSGLACAAMTCENHLQVSFTADVKSVPDLKDLAADAIASFEALREASGVQRSEPEAADTGPEGLAK